MDDFGGGIVFRTSGDPMAAASPTNSPAPPLQRIRLYGPSLVTLAVLPPFFAYYLREMKSAQGYLNDRAFRILDVISRQFVSEINGVASTMDAANILPEQLDLRQRSDVLSRRAKWLAGKKLSDSFPKVAEAEIDAYLRDYISDGESSVQVEDVAGSAAHALCQTEKAKGPDAAPHISICCRSGNSPLRVQFLEERNVCVTDHIPLRIRIDTKLDPDRMLARTLGS